MNEDVLKREAADWRKTMPTDPTRCVAAETLALWAEQALPAEETAVVDLHLADCARCQEVVAAFALTQPAIAAGQISEKSLPESTTASPARTWWLPVAGIAAAAAVIFIVVRQSGRETVQPVTTTAAIEPAQPIAPPAAQLPVIAPAPPPAADAKAATPQLLPRATPPAAKATAPTAQGGAPAPTVLSTRLPEVTLPAMAAPPPPAAQAPPSAPVTMASRGTQEAISASPPVVDTKKTSRGQAFTRDIVENIPTTRDPWQIINMEANRREFAANMSRGKVPGMVEFTSPIVPMNVGGSASGQQVSSAPRSAVAGAGRGGGANANAPTSVAADVFVASQPVTAWRITGGKLERLIADGKDWTAMDLDAAPVVNGNAPSQLVCWVVGPFGTIMRTVNAGTFIRIPFAEKLELVSIAAVDAERATVTSSTGRRFITIDSGQNWRELK